MKRFNLYLASLVFAVTACSIGPGGGGTNPPAPLPVAPPPSGIGNLSGTWTSSFKVPSSRQTLGSFNLQLSESGGTLKGSFVGRAPLCLEHTNQGALSPIGVMLGGSRTPSTAALSFGYTDSKGNSVSFDLSLDKQDDAGTVSGSAIADCKISSYEVQLTKNSAKK